MNIILNNPFRVIGVLAGVSAKEELKKTQRLKLYIEAEQEPDEDFSFPSLGKLERTVESVNNATARLNLNNDRVNAALFWFYNGRTITDEPAFDALKDSNAENAIEIWSKLTSSEEVTTKNCSAFQNLSNIKLAKAFNGAVNINLLEEALALKLKFLESEHYQDFIKLIADETYKTSKEDLQKLFLRQVQNEIEKSGEINGQKYIEIVNRLSFSAKQAYLKEVVQKPIDVIEKKIEGSRNKRKTNKTNANLIGRELYQATQASLSLIKNILGSTDLKYSSTSDKISDEILQCGIDYFKHYRDSNTDPSGDTLDLFRKANLLAIGNVAKQRCKENTENLQEWIEEKPERDKQNKIKGDLDGLLKIFEEFDNLPESIANARALINKCKPNLANIKTVLGTSDELYLKISTRIAGQAQGYIVEEINKVQDFVLKKTEATYLRHEKVAYFEVLKTKLKEAWEATVLTGTLDMEYDYKINRFNKNKETLQGLCSQLGVYISGTSSSSTQSPYRSSTSTTRPSTTPSNESEFPEWAKWVIGIIIFIILIKACN